MLSKQPKKMWEERARLAAEMRSSGMQQKEWCEERGINPGTFRWWVERLKELEITQGIKDITPAGWVEVLGGKEIRVKDEPSATVTMQLSPEELDNLLGHTKLSGKLRGHRVTERLAA
jgi:orotate phosphoribosyltransferase-like protein